MNLSHKLKDERSKYIQAIKQPLISIDPRFFYRSNEIKIQGDQSQLPKSFYSLLQYFKYLNSLTTQSITFDIFVSKFHGSEMNSLPTVSI